MKRWIFILCLSFWSLIIPKAQAQLFELDTSFLPVWKRTFGNFNAPLSTVANIILLDDGRLVVGGSFAAGRYQGFPLNRLNGIVRLFPNGDIDPSFNGNAPNGGVIKKYNHKYFSRGATLDLGVWDSSGNFLWNYMPPSIINQYRGSTYNYHIYPDDRVLLFGSYTSFVNAFPGIRTIIRTAANGAWDTTFNHGCNQPVTRVFPLKSGKLLLYTPFGSSYDGVPVGRLFQIDTAGNLDTNFRTNFPNGELKPLYEDSLGRIYIGGHTMTNPANVSDTTFLVRLLPNGDYDTTYNNFGTYGNRFTSGEVLTEGPGGRLLIGGLIRKYQGNQVSNFVITDVNGNFDSVAMQGITGADLFDPVQGPGMTNVIAIEKEKTGSYLVGGCFLGFNSHPTEMLLRLWPRFPVGVQELAAWEVKVYPVPARVGEPVWLRLPQLPNGEQLLVYDAQGRLVQKQMLQSTNPSIQLPKSGLYFLQIQNPNGVAHWRGKVVVVE
jgi:hypothetical protein